MGLMQPICECWCPARGSCSSRTSSTSQVCRTSWCNPCGVLHDSPATQVKVRQRIPLPWGALTTEFKISVQRQEQDGAKNFCLVLDHIPKPKERKTAPLRCPGVPGPMYLGDKVALALWLYTRRDGVHSRDSCDGPASGQHGSSHHSAPCRGT